MKKIQKNIDPMKSNKLKVFKYRIYKLVIN